MDTRFLLRLRVLVELFKVPLRYVADLWMSALKRDRKSKNAETSASSLRLVQTMPYDTGCEQRATAGHMGRREETCRRIREVKALVQIVE